MLGTVPKMTKLELPGKMIQDIKSLNQFCFSDKGLTVRKASEVGPGRFIDIKLTTKRIIQNFVFANTFDCSIIRKGQSIKYTSDIASQNCFPLKLSTIPYKEMGSLAPDLTPEQEATEEVAETSLKRGKLWKCNSVNLALE